MKVTKKTYIANVGGFDVPCIAIYVGGKESVKIPMPSGRCIRSVIKIAKLYQDIATTQNIDLSEEVVEAISDITGLAKDVILALPLPVIGAVIAAIFELSQSFFLQLGDIQILGAEPVGQS